MPAIVLFQPDIPQNLGSIMRLCACFDTKLHIIEPCGFPFDDQRIKRTGMDYAEKVRLHRHNSSDAFLSESLLGRRVLLTTKASTPLYDFTFEQDDLLIFGRESAGVPDDFHARMDARVIIPMTTGVRSLNIAMSTAIVLSEARRQLYFSGNTHG